MGRSNPTSGPGGRRFKSPVAGCALLAAAGMAPQRRLGRMCGSLGSSGQLMPRSRGMRGLGSRPIRSMSGGASSAAWRSSASASLIQLTRRASASGSYARSTSCPRGGKAVREPWGRDLSRLPSPVAAVGLHQQRRCQFAFCDPLWPTLGRVAVAVALPGALARFAPGRVVRRGANLDDRLRATRSRRVVMRGLRAR